MVHLSDCLNYLYCTSMRVSRFSVCFSRLSSHLVVQILQLSSYLCSLTILTIGLRNLAGDLPGDARGLSGGQLHATGYHS